MIGRLRCAALAAVATGLISPSWAIGAEGPAPMTAGHLALAAATSGFDVESVSVEIPHAVRPKFPFSTVSYDHDRLVHLRDHYGLEKVIEGAKDEWSAQLMLKDWVYKAIPGGNPKVNVATAREILQHAAKGETFYCTHYAITYTECALALGWQCRKIAVDRNHGPDGMESSHHGVAEVWSNQFCKWIVIDPQSNLHFEKHGLPLNAWEIRREFLEDQGESVDHIVGIPPDSIHKNPAIVWWNREDEDETATYFWFYVEDQAVRASDHQVNKYIFPQDDANKDLIWYQNGDEIHGGRFHVAYRKDRFLPTRRIEDAYWTVGIVEPTVSESSDGIVQLSLDSYCPGLIGYESRSRGSRWESVKDPSAVSWALRPGINSLELRTVGDGGATGPTTTLQLSVKTPKPQANP